MDRLRRMFRAPADEVRPALEAAPSPALTAARLRHRLLLRRADRAIKEAMAHADEAFGPPRVKP